MDLARPTRTFADFSKIAKLTTAQPLPVASEPGKARLFGQDPSNRQTCNESLERKIKEEAVRNIKEGRLACKKQQPAKAEGKQIKSSDSPDEEVDDRPELRVYRNGKPVTALEWMQEVFEQDLQQFDHEALDMEPTSAEMPALVDSEDKENVDYQAPALNIQSIIGENHHCSVEDCTRCRVVPWRRCSTIAEVTEPTQTTTLEKEERSKVEMKSLWMGSSECVANNTRKRTRMV